MKKVLFFLESLSGGGAEKVLSTLVKNLDKKKFDVTVLIVVNTGVYIHEIESHCNLKYILPKYESLSSFSEKLKYKLEYHWIYNQNAEKVYRRYITEEYDIEVAFVEGFATKLIAASSNKRSKKICWVHIDMEKNPYADAYYHSIEEERAAYKKYDKIISVSKSVKNTFERKFSLSNNVIVIYNPIDAEEIIRKSQEMCIIEKHSEFIMVSVGRLQKQKGYDRLIVALDNLNKFNFKYQLYILGEGSERSNLEKLIKQKNLDSTIHLIGFQKNPYKWLALADAFICSSRAEGYSLAIAEAMILGVPVFSVECAGPNELLDYGNYGVMVNNTDEDLERMIHSLLNSEYDLSFYKKLAKERKEFFEMSTTIDAVERIFEEI